MSFFVRFSDTQVLEDVRRVVGDSTYSPVQPRELCGRLFTTCYMGSENSTEDTRRRAKDLAEEVGRYVDQSLSFTFNSSSHPPSLSYYYY